jgi:hypothetical protein
VCISVHLFTSGSAFIQGNDELMITREREGWAACLSHVNVGHSTKSEAAVVLQSSLAFCGFMLYSLVNL